MGFASRKVTRQRQHRRLHRRWHRPAPQLKHRLLRRRLHRRLHQRWHRRAHQHKHRLLRRRLRRVKHRVSALWSATRISATLVPLAAPVSNFAIGSHNAPARVFYDRWPMPLWCLAAYRCGQFIDLISLGSSQTFALYRSRAAPSGERDPQQGREGPWGYFSVARTLRGLESNSTDCSTLAASTSRPIEKWAAVSRAEMFRPLLG